MKVFVGGLGGCGKRVVQKILQRAGFFLGRPGMINNVYDSPFVINCYRKMLAGDSSPELLKKYKNRVLSVVDHKPDWSLKSGMSMLCIEQMVKVFPDMKFILTIRDPVNQIAFPRSYDPEVLNILMGSDANYQELSVNDKSNFWRKAYKKGLKLVQKHIPDQFMIVQMEDLVKDDGLEIARILDFLEINRGPEDFIDLIEDRNDLNLGYKKYSKEEQRDIKQICQPITEIISELKNTMM